MKRRMNPPIEKLIDEEMVLEEEKDFEEERVSILLLVADFE
jgi:hypothetical protein